ncbi:hypothetical protein PENTCL1PPCAC_1233, partial [Pristionchus entomophagus]
QLMYFRLIEIVQGLAKHTIFLTMKITIDIGPIGIVTAPITVSSSSYVGRTILSCARTSASSSRVKANVACIIRFGIEISKHSNNTARTLGVGMKS